MTSGIRTAVEVGTPRNCPAAHASADAETTINNVARSVGATASGMRAEEFTIDAEATLDRPEMEEIFEYDARSVYRFERERDHGCVCERIEQYGCPVSEVRARDGTLVVSFHAPDIDTIRQIVTELKTAFDEIHVRQLTRPRERSNNEFVFVDRTRLTDRQREVLETSQEMGYFEYPKQANAGEVAEALGIAPSTFREHLAAAQRKLLGAILDA